MELIFTPFDKFVDDLKAQFSLKDDTLEGDLLVVAREIAAEQTMIDFAHVAGFTADPTKRAEWWHVRLLFLSFPLINVVFTLQTPHFTGREIFLMGGKKVFIKALDTRAYRDGGGGPGDPGGPGGGGGDGRPPGGGNPGFTLVR
ncbi:MAG: hypothetical protein LBG06_08115 [Deltaproteobacteria bacterium]|nr:hypothetical protein [Deltaproteobacteria bacterium]